MNAEGEENNASGAAAPARPDEAPSGADGACADDGPSPFKKRRIEEVRRLTFFCCFWKSSAIRFQKKTLRVPPDSSSPCSSATPLPALPDSVLLVPYS